MNDLIKKILPMTVREEPFFWLSSKRKNLARFRDKHKGQRCFIVGNGPSLNKMDLELMNSDFSFAVNGIFYKTDECGYRPDYYVVEDRHVVLDNVERIKSFQPKKGGAKFFSSRYRNLLGGGENTYFLNFNRGFYEPTSSYFEIPRFSPNACDNVYVGQSVTIVNLQLAYWMGFSEVYLIGMDFNYSIPDSAKVDGNVLESTEDDVNHFHPDYFGAGKKWHDPKLHNVMKSYQLCKLMFEMDGRKVVNATHGGKLELFERANYEGLF